MKCRPLWNSKAIRKGEISKRAKSISYTQKLRAPKKNSETKKKLKKTKQNTIQSGFRTAERVVYLVRVASAPISFRLKWFMCVCNQFYGHRLRRLTERPDYILMPPLDVGCWMLMLKPMPPALRIREFRWAVAGAFEPSRLPRAVASRPSRSSPSIRSSQPSSSHSNPLQRVKFFRLIPTWSNQIGDTQTPIWINKQKYAHK